MLTFLLSLVDDTPVVPGLRMPGRLDGRWNTLFGVVVTGEKVVAAGVVVLNPPMGLRMNGVASVTGAATLSSLSTSETSVVVNPNGFFVGRMRRLRTTLLPTLAAAESGSLLLNGRRTLDSAVVNKK